jgi:hypothetical protein
MTAADPHELAALDPLAFVREALSDLPADPADVSDDDLSQVEAIGQGLACYVGRLKRDSDDLALRVVRGERDDDIEAEVYWLIAYRERCEAAKRKLQDFTYAAVRARGIDPDRLGGP